jgi:hypothetical protein
MKEKNLLSISVSKLRVRNRKEKTMITWEILSNQSYQIISGDKGLFIRLLLTVDAARAHPMERKR